MPIDRPKILALIPARGGSKGIPGKNIRLFAGKPLLAWTILAAQSCPLISDIVVSTDDARIADTALEWGALVPFMRPADLARDDTPGIAPVMHALSVLPGYDYVLLLQPTSPLRSTEDISECILMALRLNADSIVSVCESAVHPYWTYLCNDRGELRPVVKTPPIARRQDLPEVFCLNGAMYLSRVDWLIKSAAFVTSATLGIKMPKERSIDIDTPLDWKIAELMMETSP